MAEKKAKKQPAGGVSETVYIPHEEMPHGNGAPVLQPTVATVDQQIKLELAKFTLADAGIAQLKKNYEGLEINGADDKEGYKKVREAWRDVQSKRTGLEKKGLELRGGYGVITKAIKAEEDRLVDLITPLEDGLHKKWKAIDDEKERVKKEQEQAEQKQLMERVEAVQSLGMTFKDGFYQIGDTVTVDVASLRAMPADVFEKLKTAITKKAEEIRAADEAAAALQRERQAEFERQQAELKRQQEEMAEQQRAMKEQQEQLQRDRQEAENLKRDIRVGKFLALGMVQQSGWLVYDNGLYTVQLEINDIMSRDDENSTALLSSTRSKIEKIDTDKATHLAEVKAEQSERERREKHVASEMEAAGFKYSYTARAFIFENDIDAFSQSFDDMLTMTDKDVQNLAGEWAKKRIASASKSMDLKIKRELEQKKQDEAALGDIERMDKQVQELWAIVNAIEPTIYKTKRFQKMASDIKMSLIELLNKK